MLRFMALALPLTLTLGAQPVDVKQMGDRTGKFRLGTTNLIANEKGDSRISFEDYAVALVDEIETPAHERGQLSIGY